MSEILYRRALEEKLKDLSGELKTGRETFTWNSELYKKLDKSISAVLKVLEEHSGEETLFEDVRKDLEEKIHQMKEAAGPYRDEKLKQGALSGGGLMTGRTAGAIEVTRKRFQAAVDILKVDETLNRTVKREFLGFRVGKPGFKGVGICNSDYGAKDSSSTANTISVGQDSKLRVGKIGIKFHSKHKSLQLSSGVAFG